MYMPKSLWPRFQERLVAELKSVKMGDVRDFSNFMGAVIDEGAFDTITGYIEHAKTAPDAQDHLRRRRTTSARAGSSSPP